MTFLVYQAAQKDLESKDDEAGKLLITRDKSNEEDGNVYDKDDSDDSNPSDDQNADHSAERGDHSSTRSREDDQGAASQKAQTTAAGSATIERPVPANRSRFPSCTTITFGVFVIYLCLAFYELYTVFTPEVRPTSSHALLTEQ
jgi:hypothetical protein